MCKEVNYFLRSRAEEVSSQEIAKDKKPTRLIYHANSISKPDWLILTKESMQIYFDKSLTISITTIIYFSTNQNTYLDILVHNLIGLCLITSRGLTFLASQTSLLASVQNSSSSKCGINCQTGWQNWCFSNSQVSSPTWLTICKVCNIIKSPKNREEMRLTVLGLSWQVSLIVKGHISFPHTSRWTCLQPVCGTARSRITSLTSHC